MYAAASQARGEWMTTVHRQYMLGRRALPTDYFDESTTERARDRASVKRLLRKYKDGTSERREVHQLMEALVGEPDAQTLRELLQDEPDLADATGNDTARLRHMLSKGMGNTLQELYNSDTGSCMHRQKSTTSLLEALRRDSGDDLEHVAGDDDDDAEGTDSAIATGGDEKNSDDDTNGGDANAQAKTIKNKIAQGYEKTRKITMTDLLIDDDGATTSAKAILEKWEQGILGALAATKHPTVNNNDVNEHAALYHVALPVFRHEVNFDDDDVKEMLKPGKGGALRGLQKDKHCDTEDKECKEDNVCMCALIDQSDLNNVTQKVAGIMVRGERYTVPQNSGVTFYAHAGTSNSVKVVLVVHRHDQVLRVQLGGGEYDFSVDSHAYVELYVGTDKNTKQSGLFMHTSVTADDSGNATTKETPLLTTDAGIEVAAVVFTEGTYSIDRPKPPEMPPLVTQLKMMSRGREVPSKCSRFALRNDWQSAVAFGVTTQGTHPKLYPNIGESWKVRLVVEPEYPYREALTAKEETVETRKHRRLPA